MKKFFLFAIVAILCLSFASMAFAELTLSGVSGAQGSTIFGGGTYKVSTNVILKGIATVSAYCAATQHTGSTPNNNGQQYYTLSTDPAIPGWAAASPGPTSCGGADVKPSGAP